MPKPATSVMVVRMMPAGWAGSKPRGKAGMSRCTRHALSRQCSTAALRCDGPAQARAPGAPYLGWHGLTRAGGTGRGRLARQSGPRYGRQERKPAPEAPLRRSNRRRIARTDRPCPLAPPEPILARYTALSAPRSLPARKRPRTHLLGPKAVETARAECYARVSSVRLLTF